MYIPRPSQQAVLAYRGGKMGVSAVPGSGKTHTLSRLAADIIASGVLDEGDPQGFDREVLIVTLVNSAVDNFATRIAGFIKEANLLPNLGYRVRTLHGLAHDIVRERPSLVDLQETFTILDERAASAICQTCAASWLHSHPHDLDDFIKTDLDEYQEHRVRHNDLPDLVESMAANFIRFAKDNQLPPDGLSRRLDALPFPLPLSEMGCAIYADYQRALDYRGAVDFDDLIRLALKALKTDAAYLERLRQRWPYILEDEAQDSSRLQEEILSLLAGPAGNWVRVGDPNQAIYETFTTASPKYLRDFLRRGDVSPCAMPTSGRSTHSIIELANKLVRWTMAAHHLRDACGALVGPPFIKGTEPGDPQPNPPDNPDHVRLILDKFTPQKEIEAVARSVEAWLAQHPNETVAILSPSNHHAFMLVDELKRRKIDYVENLRSTSSTRAAAKALKEVIDYLADPQSPGRLADAYRAWRQCTLTGAVDPGDLAMADTPGDGRDAEELAALASAHTEQAARILSKCRLVEDYLWPRAGQDWLAEAGLETQYPEIAGELHAFRSLARRWHEAVLLPIDQLVLTLAQDLFCNASDLAIAHKLAVVLRQASQEHSAWRLPELNLELRAISQNERRFLGFSEDDSGFDPERYRGKVVVSTIHKAKGLEWDRVYLTSVNNYDFPSSDQDHFIAEKWFIRDKLNLEAEALAQLAAVARNGHDDPYAWPEEGDATLAARREYIGERLRLLYVGITRARKELIITTNTGRDGKMSAAEALLALEG